MIACVLVLKHSTNSTDGRLMCPPLIVCSPGRDFEINVDVLSRMSDRFVLMERWLAILAAECVESRVCKWWGGSALNVRTVLVGTFSKTSPIVSLIRDMAGEEEGRFPYPL